MHEMIVIWGILADAFFILFLGWCSVSDIRKRQIPNQAILLMLIVGILNVFVCTAAGQIWWYYPAGLMIEFPFILSWLKNKMGAGDVKLMLVCGLFLGLPAALISAGLMLIILFVIAIYLVFTKRSLKTRIPLGPVIAFSCAATIVGIFFIR